MSRILLLGDLVIDNYIIGSCNRIAPEGPIPIINVEYIKKSLGCIGNVLNNVKDFYSKIYFITCINNDDINIISNLLHNYDNIIYKNFNQLDRNLIIKNRIYSNNKIISRFDEERINNLNEINENEIILYINKIINNINIVILSDYSKGFFTDSFTQRVINLCNENNIITLVDPKGNNYNKYKNCTFIKPNKKEAEDFFQNKINEKNLYDFGKRIIKDLNIKYVLNTLGNEGMRFIYNNINNEIQVYKKNIIPSEIIDVTGCGDTIISVLSIYLINEYKYIEDNNNIENMLDLLTKIGNIAVTHLGCYNLNKNDWNNISKKNVVVFTNGCFDIIHIGHLNFLKKCKKLGNKLIIGINSDDSIKRLKGNSRPINNLEKRILYLKELEIADEIIPFYEDNPLELIKKIKPNKLVKGGDYKYTDIIGREFVDETIIIPYIDGYSTTNIIKDIENNLNKNI